LRQLEIFLAVARFENVTRAADSLSLSQPAASGALRELEQQFDVVLFDRIGKRLQLSELGARLRPEAEALVARAEEFQRHLASPDTLGRLRVGATLTIGNYLAVNMIAAFRARYPEAALSLQVENTEAIARRVADFELDVGLVEGELQHPDLEVTPWRDDELVVFAAPEHPLAERGRLSDRELLAWPWVVREPGSGTRQTFDVAMYDILSDLDITLELQHTEAIKRAVEAQLGLGCLSRISLREAFARGSLVPLSVPRRDFRRRFHIVLRKDKFHSATLQRWLSLTMDEWSQGP
jgi:DNA-binding transcriptional LysR family regulator